MTKIKVLHIVSSLDCGGAETLIMNIYRYIDRQNIQFDFLCLNSSTEGVYESEVKSLGGHIYKVLPHEKKLKKLYKVLKANKYNNVHCHVMFYSGYVQFIAKIAGVKNRITHSHSAFDIKKETFVRKIYIFTSRILINLFSNIKISCGSKAAKYLYGKRSKYIILNNGIDLDKYKNVSMDDVNELKKSLKIKNNEKVIGHVGSFLDVKNQIYFINLAKEFIKRGIRFKIVLVGEGKNFDKICNLINNEKLNNYFILAGHRNDINIFMNMFDLFIMPSLYEGFPLVVVEALAGNNICFLSENISKETNLIDDRVFYFDLSEDYDNVVNLICEKMKCKKDVNAIEILENLGYSIKKTSDVISNIYQGGN